jgi:hypothetical protein
MTDVDPKIQKVVENLKGKKAKVKTLSTMPENTKSSALNAKIKKDLEELTGANLSKVRVHTGGNAADCAKELGAKAFTMGNDIYLAKPASASDLGLLAHELTHVVQQGGGKMVAAIKGKALVSK